MDGKGDSTPPTKIKNVRSFTIDDMKLALEHLKTGKSIREAARLTNVPYATVRRHWLRLKCDSSSPEEKRKESFKSVKEPTSSSKLKSILKKTATIAKPVVPEPLFFNKNQLKLFSEHQEMTLATLFNGKNGTDCRKIAYEMAVEWKISLDKTWVNEKMADVDWITNFRKRLPDLLEKQYRINQKSLSKEGSSRQSNVTSLKVSSPSFLGINKSQNSPTFSTLRHSNSSELDSFGNDSSNSNHDVDIVKMELSECEPSRKRSSSSWDKRFTSIFSSENGKKRQSTIRRTSSEDVKFFLPDARRQEDLLEKSNFNSFSQTEKDNDLNDPKHQDDIRSIIGRSSSNYNQNRRQSVSSKPSSTVINIDENTSTSLHIINDDGNSNESDGTTYSTRSKKSRIDDVQIDKRNFVRMVKGMNAVTKQKLDADELFLLSLLPALKRIAEKDKLKVKIRLLEVVDQF